MSWVVGATHRILQGCYGNDDIVLSILELKLVGRSVGDCHNQSGAVHSNERKGMAAKG